MNKDNKTNESSSISDDIQDALNWWNELPIQDIKECKLGWANLCMKYHPNRDSCYGFTDEEIQQMYKNECI